jgi:hypothetical protein
MAAAVAAARNLAWKWNCFNSLSGGTMPEKKSSSSSPSSKGQRKVHKVMKEYKSGKLRSGGSGKKVSSRKQAVAIGLSEARKAGAKIPKKKTSKKSS